MTLNLSCGKCNAIRPFSGDPSACDVCGWVYVKPSSEKENSSSIQNLFCDKCKATRPFFGTTPVCYECGWVYNRSSKPARTAPKRATSDFSFNGIIGWIIFALIVWFMLPDHWTDPIKYSIEYTIDIDQVHWNEKPTDCDFVHAPLGVKGCHYKKTVAAHNAAGYWVAGDDTPVYGNDTKTGKPIISYDKGKTWEWLSEDAPKTPDLKVKSVDIGWVKVTE